MRAGWNTLIRRLKPNELQRPPKRTAAGADDDQPAACGWYESSWELERGLAVVEVGDLELAVWQLVSAEPTPAYLSAPV